MQSSSSLLLSTLLIIAWLVFGTMASSLLYFKNRRNNQVLGVTLSAAHAQAQETQDIIIGYKRMSYQVLLLSAGLSLLLLLQAVEPYAEFCILILVLANLFLNWFEVHRSQRKLQALKQEKGWIYRRERIVTVDLNVVKEKGKAGVSAVWAWLFLLLSFIPTVYLLFSAAVRALYPIGFSLIGPFRQFSMIFMYYQTLNSHTPALSENTEINKACARTQERIRTTTATLSALSVLVFWFLFNLSVLYAGRGILMALPVVILIIALLIIAYWQQKEISASGNACSMCTIKAESTLSSSWTGIIRDM